MLMLHVIIGSKSSMVFKCLKARDLLDQVGIPSVSRLSVENRIDEQRRFGTAPVSEAELSAVLQAEVGWDQRQEGREVIMLVAGRRSARTGLMRKSPTLRRSTAGI